MHIEARSGLDRMLTTAAIDRGAAWRVLDLGGRDINGGIRDLLPKAEWTGMDLVPGPGVDLVHDATQPWPESFPVFDIVVCTEVLEHVQDWRMVVAAAYAALDPSGPQAVFVTCASDGRRPHGASGDMWPAPGEWYANVSPEELREAMSRVFTEVLVEYNPMPGDAYAYGRGAKGMEAQR